ncbi:hypothetical protein RUM43_012315 [Polyplax serrata]|uniref:Uncharacterized protein n=1 Tax=Polyplax serrata TaxID=468196 RepID=A0AAN8RSV3_POLSC
MSRTLILLFLTCTFGLLLGQETTEEEQPQAAPQPQTGLTSLPQDFTLSDGLLRAVGTAGVLITGIAGIAALLSFLLPMFGFRSCMLFGTCDNGYETTGYNSVGSNSIYEQPGFNGYQYNGSPYKKRSLEYVGPILKMLSAAYEKYGPKPIRQGKSTPVEGQS